MSLAPNSILHLSLPVSDLSASIVFYSSLFDRDPSKSKKDYAKFDIVEPPLSLALHEKVGLVREGVHMGFRLHSVTELDHHRERIEKTGLQIRIDDGICCYADQRKFWIVDPDGYEWEFYVLIRDTEINRETMTEQVLSGT